MDQVNGDRDRDGYGYDRIMSGDHVLKNESICIYIYK